MASITWNIGVMPVPPATCTKNSQRFQYCAQRTKNVGEENRNCKTTAVAGSGPRPLYHANMPLHVGRVWDLGKGSAKCERCTRQISA